MTNLKSAAAAVLLLGGLWSGNASAADVTLVLHNLDDEGGQIRVAICDKPNWLSYNCPFRQRADTHEGDVTVVVKDVPPGDWAAIAYHDVNMNDKLDENFLGIPTEQFGFTNNPGYNHKPDFAESQFTVGTDPVTQSIDLSK
jgi:uncharacterized protein (DUF2141 family)